MALADYTDVPAQEPTPTPASYDVALGFEQSMFGNHGGILDAPSKIWIPVAVIYTFILCMGIMFLYFQRYSHAVRLRGFWLTCSAIASLHIYLLLILLDYPLRFWYGCTAEFWVMATLFPFGLGLYQSKQITYFLPLGLLSICSDVALVSNARFIFYYQTQQELLITPQHNKRRKIPIWYRNPIGFLKHYNNMDFLAKTQVFVGCTWIFAILSSSFMYFGSINFHEHYGFFGEWSGTANCHRGPHGEWYVKANA